MSLFREGDRVADRILDRCFGTVTHGDGASPLYPTVRVRWDGAADGACVIVYAATLRLVRWEDGPQAYEACGAGRGI